MNTDDDDQAPDPRDEYVVETGEDAAAPDTDETDQQTAGDEDDSAGDDPNTDADSPGDDEEPAGDEDAHDESADDEDATEESGADEPTERQPDSRGRGRNQRRRRQVARLKQQAAEAKQTAAEERARRQELEAQLNAGTGQAGSHDDDGGEARPDVKDFESYDDWAKAVEAWADKKVKGSQRAKPQKGTQPTGKDLTPQETADGFIDGIEDDGVAESYERAIDTHDDYIETIFTDRTLPLSNIMLEAINETPDPGEVLYQLGRRRDEASEIYQMSPLKAARAIEKFSKELKVAKGGGVNNRAPKKRQRSTAPKATTTVNDAGGSVGQKNMYDEDVSTDEFMRRRGKEELKRRQNRF